MRRLKYICQMKQSFYNEFRFLPMFSLQGKHWAVEQRLPVISLIDQKRLKGGK